MIDADKVILNEALLYQITEECLMNNKPKDTDPEELRVAFSIVIAEMREKKQTLKDNLPDAYKRKLK